MRRNKLVRAAAAGGLIVGALLPAGTAFAQYGEPDPGSGGADNGGSGNSDDGTLPLTGGDALQLTLIGGGLALGGTILVRSGRRKGVTA
jgi:LPXTG-motif cell wall-anchored protein